LLEGLIGVLTYSQFLSKYNLPVIPKDFVVVMDGLSSGQKKCFLKISFRCYRHTGWILLILK